MRQNETDFRPQEANSNSSNRIRKCIASKLQISVSDLDLIRTNLFDNDQEFRSSDRLGVFFEWADVFKNQWDSSLRYGAEGPDFFPWRADFIGIGFPFRIRAADFFQCGGVESGSQTPSVASGVVGNESNRKLFTRQNFNFFDTGGFEAPRARRIDLARGRIGIYVDVKYVTAADLVSHIDGHGMTL